LPFFPGLIKKQKLLQQHMKKMPKWVKVSKWCKTIFWTHDHAFGILHMEEITSAQLHFELSGCRRKRVAWQGWI
jgi:ABC-type antimicrobial peptide transport system ATPase subunit